MKIEWCGNKYEVYDHVPEGWRVLGGAINRPAGMRWIDNRTSMFSAEHKKGFVPEDVAIEWWRDNT